jgi:hypothetical protein
VQNYVTINISSDEGQQYLAVHEQILTELRRSNEITGELRDQLTSEPEAGRSLLHAPKVDRNWINLFLVNPLMAD